MPSKETLDLIAAIATLATPVILAVLGGLGWLLKSTLEKSQAKDSAQQERIRELEDKLREDRIAIYNSLLEPFFLLFTSDAVFAQDPKYKNKKKNDVALGLMLTVEYRRVGFKLSLVAGDSVVRSFNKLMQHVYNAEQAEQSSVERQTALWMRLLGELLLEIRKSMGNEATTLDRWEMLEWFLKDAAQMRELAASSSN